MFPLMRVKLNEVEENITTKENEIQKFIDLIANNSITEISEFDDLISDENILTQIYTKYLSYFDFAIDNELYTKKKDELYKILRVLLYHVNIFNKDAISLSIRNLLYKLLSSKDLARKEKMIFIEFGNYNTLAYSIFDSIFASILRPFIKDKYAYIFDKSNLFFFKKKDFSEASKVNFISCDILEFFSEEKNCQGKMVSIENIEIENGDHFAINIAKYGKNINNRNLFEALQDNDALYFIFMSEFIHVKEYMLNKIVQIIKNLKKKNPESSIYLIIRENFPKYWPHLAKRLKNIGGKLYEPEELKLNIINSFETVPEILGPLYECYYYLGAKI